MYPRVRAVGKGLVWMSAAVVLILGWVASVEAKDCTLQAWDCAPGDTLVQSGTLQYDLYAYGEEHALILADGVWIDCDSHWVVLDPTRQSAVFRLGHGSGLYNCYVYGGEISVKLNGWQAWIIGGGTYGSSQEGLHFTHGVQGNYVCCLTIQVPEEALYFQGSHGNVVEWVTVYGQNATYINDGASYNQVKYSTLRGGSNRANFSAAGPQNDWFSNDYGGGIVRSGEGSQYPNWIGPSPNATIHNFDGSLYVY
jgi:hypothetical protein